MKRQTTLVIMILMILFMSLQITAKTHVLIIGNGDYEDSAIQDLPGALEDAKRMKETLIRYEMATEENIRVITNPPAMSLEIEIREFLEREYDEDTRLIFYYSGHGYTKEEKNDNNTYLVPANTREKYRERFLINLTQILKENIEKIKDRETLILLDACYSGSILKDADKSLTITNFKPVNLLKMIEGTRINIMVASGAKETAKEESGKGGYFTKYLIEGIEGKANTDDNEYIDFKELGEYVKKNVTYASNEKQKPEYSGKEDMIITEVKEQIMNNIYLELLSKKREEKIDDKDFGKYTDILAQKEEIDTEAEKEMRECLIKYYKDDKRYDDTDLLSLKGIAQILFKDNEGVITGQKDLQRLPQEKPEKTDDTGQQLEVPSQTNAIDNDEPVDTNEKKQAEETLEKLTKELIAGTLDTERFQELGKILTQKEIEDTQEEATIREILLNYNTLPKLGIEYVIMMTDSYFEKTPVTQQFHIETEPTNADIYIDGEYTGISPVTSEMEEGTHSIEARKKGYKTSRQIKTIGTQSNDSSLIEVIRIELEKETGRLSIISVPNDASIYLNSIFKGTSPQMIEGLEEGTYDLEITKTGYEAKIETINIKIGQTTELQIKLTKKQEEKIVIIEKEETGIGYLKIDRNYGKNYTIDGEKKGWIVPKEIKLPVGMHLIEIEEIGKVEIEIKENETIVIDYDTKIEKEDRTPKLQSLYMVDWQGNKKSTFNKNDSGVAFAFMFTNWMDTHEIYGKWFKPDGSLYGKGNIFTYDKTSDGKVGRKFIGFNFEKSKTAFETMKANPGLWRVEVYLDDKYLETLFFTFKRY